MIELREGIFAKKRRRVTINIEKKEGKQMKYYISDLHFGHENAIRFDDRPFENADEMDAKMIELWNEKVTENDEVYIVGDFSYKSGKTADWYLDQLKGRKHLIIGNHDRKTFENELAMQHFESVHQMLQIKDEEKWIFLCHYPMAEWNGSRHGSWLIYGHIHGNQNDVFAFMQTRTRALNAGACINNYVPVTFQELKYNNQQFQEEYNSMQESISEGAKQQIDEMVPERKTIKELLSEYQGEYQPSEIDWGNPLGEEIW